MDKKNYATNILTYSNCAIVQAGQTKELLVILDYHMKPKK
jgi:hypothetical protein